MAGVRTGPRHRLADIGTASSAPIEIEWRRPNRSSLLLAAALATSVAVSVYQDGTIVLAEVLLLLLLPVILPVVRRDRAIVALWLLALLWTVAQFVSDAVNHVTFFSNVAMIGVLAALLVSGLIWMHIEFEVSPALLLAALGAGWVALELVGPTAVATGNPWKYGLATPATLVVVALAYWFRVPRVGVVLVFTCLAAISLTSDSRFDFGLSIVGAAAAAVLPNRSTPRSTQASLLSALVIVAALLYVAYPSVALSGLLGDRAQEQQTRFESEDVNFLLAARVEFPQIAHLVAQTPLFGIGANGPLSSARALDALQYIDRSILPLDENLRTYLLNSAAGYTGYNAHTAAMSAALYAGVLALPFWAFVIGCAAVAVVRAASGGTMMPALVVYFAGRIGWDSLFSPLYDHTHLLLGASLAVFVFGMRSRSALPAADRARPVSASLRSAGEPAR